MFSRTEFNITLARMGKTIEQLSSMAGINYRTLSRRLQNDGVDFTCGEIVSISNALGLNVMEMNRIFFSGFVA